MRSDRGVLKVILESGIDRRVFERYVPRDTIFATFRPMFDRMGRIVDISKGGLAMEYTLLDEKTGLDKKVNVDIFNNDKKYNAFSVPCTLVYDVRINEGEGFLSTLETRRCGLKFDALKPAHLAQLESIIRDISQQGKREHNGEYASLQLQ
ncbi:MAG: hypothetical protein C4582_04190 [Desulfobacteraceae bacterium]|jgi:c-di-GMP-binding flagellar brake protein YcgR|nr:MAG: hypothetical protein C4582_04190 [Desulfobacteraceae bacterium]